MLPKRLTENGFSDTNKKARSQIKMGSQIKKKRVTIKKVGSLWKKKTLSQLKGRAMNKKFGQMVLN